MFSANMHVNRSYEKCRETFELDLCHYISSPKLSKDALLKITSKKLELFLMIT